MADRVQLPKDKHLALIVVQADAEKHKRDMGKIGEWLGARDTAIIYIAAIIIFLSIVAGCILAAVDDGQSTVRADMAKAFAALALSALGYMFGAIGRRGQSD